MTTRQPDAEAERNARQALHRVITLGMEPDGVSPEVCGPFAENISLIYEARIKGGPAAARRTFAALAAADSSGRFAALVAGQPTSEPQTRLLHFSELRMLPRLAWLIQGEIPARSLAVIFGPSGSGKSFIAIDYALTIAQSANVVYVAAEGASGYAARSQVWCDLHRKPPGGAYLWQEPINMMDSGKVSAFIETIKPVSPVLVVIDTLARCMVGGDENSARDMGLFITGCDEIKRQTGATPLIVHHTGIAGTRERGSTALRGAADVMIELTNDDGLIALRCEKTKDAKPFETRYVRLVVKETGERLDTGEPETSCVVVPADKVVMTGTITPMQRKVLETLALEIFAGPGARASQIQSATGMKEPTLYKVLSTLKKEGLIQQAIKGDPYHITEDGQAAIS
jgi:hypothetical protein